MPYKDPEAQREYDRRRCRDPKRKAANVAYKRKRYAEDPEYREKVKAASRKTPREVWRAHKLRKGSAVLGTDRQRLPGVAPKDDSLTASQSEGV